MIVLIDYGVGNINAFLNIYKQLNIPARTAKKASELEGAEKLILPGVGHFDYAMQRFNGSGMRETVDEMVRTGKKPVIGICVGMQMMAKSSDEGLLPGLGWIDAHVEKFSDSQRSAKMPLPHMGWNDVYALKNNPLFTGLEQDARFYFLHSYYFKCTLPQDAVAEAEYGIRFTAAVNHENVYGIQCHPEKSHHFGIQLLKNFAELC
ncbi:Imidazole glycerol phosphate synthase subunit HisH 1 [Chryseobacterium taklimakanense]|uniref:Imidazole glycerol phosphate synthase subunit HisH n=1 Tax=Chryseobacterium taklimakanense TaxID=536441 RepID=A0A239X791_9FLAO|nr:imidazole glycerol phosphate synthase subunit HisH [Chryseobacterium taklimakanense]SNV42419.1 Imidazole glycerol phosphate synthase subunit HisH 1 [Chryseobacterium taklimakanense]